MSIYLGNKKGKLYKGDYHPAQFYKDTTKIAGYDVVQKQGTAIECVDTYNDQLNPTIEGLSEQTVTVQGANLFDTERILPTQGWIKQSDGSFFVSNNNIPWQKIIWENTDGYTGQIAITVQHRRNEAGSRYAGAVIDIRYTDGTDAYTNGSNVTEWSTDHLLSNSTKKIEKVYWSYGTGTIGTYVKDILIAKSSTIVPYVPFVPNSPSPDHPAPIRSSEKFSIVSCGRDPATATTAHVTDPLRSVGDVSDSIEVSEGKVEVVRRIAVVKLTGNEPWGQYPSSIGQKYACISGPVLKGKRVGTILCTHDAYTPGLTTNGTELGIWPNSNPIYAGYMYWGIEYSLIGTTPASTPNENVSAFRAWLSAQDSAGTPATVQYQLETPTRTDITATPLGQALLALRTVPRYTQVYTNADLPPTIRASLKMLTQ